MSVKVPDNVRQAARQGLELHDRLGRGGTEVGLGMARKLASGDGVSEDDVRHVARYFPRHAGDNLDEDGRDGGEVSNGHVAWLLWGGDAGREWSERTVRDLDREGARG